jgi:hypothetical protein
MPSFLYISFSLAIAKHFRPFSISGRKESGENECTTCNDCKKEESHNERSLLIYVSTTPRSHPTQTAQTPTRSTVQTLRSLPSRGRSRSWLPSRDRWNRTSRWGGQETRGGRRGSLGCRLLSHKKGRVSGEEGKGKRKEEEMHSSSTEYRPISSGRAASLQRVEGSAAGPADLPPPASPTCPIPHPPTRQTPPNTSSRLGIVERRGRGCLIRRGWRE